MIMPSEGSGTVNLFRNGLFNSLETDTLDNWSFRNKNDARKENKPVQSRISPVLCKKNDASKENIPFQSRISPVMCKS